MLAISARPPQKLGELIQNATSCLGQLLLAIVVLRSDPIDTHQTPKPTPRDQIEQVRIQKPPQHQHEPPNNIRVYHRPSIPILATRNRLEKRTMQHHELNIHVRTVRPVEGLDVRGMIRCLLAIGHLLGRHGEPLVRAMYPVGTIIVPATTGEGCPFDEHVFLTVVRAGFVNYSLDQGGIIYFGSDLESPLFSDRTVKVPAKESRLEGGGIGVDRVGSVASRVDLVPGEIFDDGDEVAVGSAFHAHNVHNLTVIPRFVVYWREVLARDFDGTSSGDIIFQIIFDWCIRFGYD
mmetsp:Transcript_9498/g.20024  ORF Transcript_9498/g.20024 Transcript_9498/m.20024 type:complete len:292 (-) Transcript_9498:221-1096(-)